MLTHSVYLKKTMTEEVISLYKSHKNSILKITSVPKVELLKGLELNVGTQVNVQNRKLFVGLCLLSLFIWILYPVKMYLLVIDVSNISIIYVTAATFTAYSVALLPIFPGGLGGFEGAMTGLLLAFGLAVDDAVAVTVVFRFITFWFVMVLALGVIIARNSIRACKKRGKDVK